MIEVILALSLMANAWQVFDGVQTRSELVDCERHVAAVSSELSACKRVRDAWEEEADRAVQECQRVQAIDEEACRQRGESRDLINEGGAGEDLIFNW